MFALQNEELGTQIKTVQFLQDSIEFSKVVSRAVPKLQELLLSKTHSDICEAVDLFTTGYLFGIKGMEAGMQLMLQLVWSPDKEKRDAVSNAYKKMLFDTQETGRMHAIKMVQNLMGFLRTLEYGHYTALEVLVREWVSSDDIDALIVQVLFERFTLKLEGTSADESRLALQLLIMVSQEKRSVAKANLPLIESIALGERARRDPRIYTGCLEFMLNAVDVDTSSAKYYKRHEVESPLVQQLLQQLRAYFFHPRVPEFDRLAMRALEFVYRMCQTPDLICQRLVVELLRKMRDYCKQLRDLNVRSEVPCSQGVVPDTQLTQPDTQPAVASAGEELRMPAFLLARLLFMVGYMTLKELIFLDIDVYNNMKYRQELTECEQRKRFQARPKQSNAHLLDKTLTRRSVQSLNMSATESLKRLSGSAAEPQQEPDEDLVGATAEDNIAELINHICEDVLLFADTALLGKLFPYIREVCKYPAKYHDAALQQAASLALIRCMCVSARCCETHMPFLMNILAHTRNMRIKCNIIIGLSDLTFRFPNVIEPWTGHFYSTLHERDTELRLTAVKMLAHLILHEMIRVKGQIADLALCLVDAHDEIRHRTQQFFKEIANKSNILYNVLPDIISKLSDSSLKLEEEKYREIMRYILGLIQKDRQVETLVEKLCLRFDVTREERQWRDVAFCLTLLTYNERCIKKLSDNVQNFRDKLQVDEVYEAFRLIINNTGKLAKPELKAALQEFETRLKEVRDGNGPVVAEPTESASSVPQQKKARRGTAARARKKTQRVGSASSTDEELEVGQEEEDSSPKVANRQKKTVDGSASNSDDDFDAKRRGNKTTSGRKERVTSKSRSHIVRETASSSEDEEVETQASQRKRGRRMRN